MAIINQVVSGGGTTPTGTKSITANGVYDVTDYASADVQVPTTAPAYYRPFELNANGNLTPPYSATQTVSFAGIKSFSQFNGAYQDCTHITTVDLSDATKINGGGTCFQGCTGLVSADLSSVEEISSAGSMFLNCTNLTTVDLGNLKKVVAGGCGQMFAGCTSLVNLNLGKFDINYRYSSSGSCCWKMFYGCTSLRTIDLSGLKAVVDLTYACQSMFQGCTSLTSVDLRNLCRISNSSSCCNAMFQGCTALTTVDISGLVKAEGGAANMFSGCTSLASVTFDRLVLITTGTFTNCTGLRELRFPGLALRTAIPSGFNAYFLSGCSNVTVHFPAEWETLMSASTAIMNGMGGTNTTVLFDLPNVRTLDLSNIVDANCYFMLHTAADSLQEVTTIDLHNMKIAGDGAFSSAFGNSPKLTTIDFSSLEETVGSSPPFSSAFVNCTALTTVTFPALTKINGTLSYMFSGCTSLASVSFPAIKSTSVITSGAFSNMLGSVNGCTLHFPSNLSGTNKISSLSGYPNFGGTNTVIAYDLPATE